MKKKILTDSKGLAWAVNDFKADIICMAFGFFDERESINEEIRNAVNQDILLVAAASNYGGNYGRTFPARHRDVFAVHATDAYGQPLAFNSFPEPGDVNYGVLGEHVCSASSTRAGSDGTIKSMTGTSVAVPIFAAFCAAILAFVRQNRDRARPLSNGDVPLDQWLRRYAGMDKVLRSIAKRNHGAYNYIGPFALFKEYSSAEKLYERLEHIRYAEV